MEHLSFPSIEQFRTVVKTVRDTCSYHGWNLPVLRFKGTPKLHGTNASVVLNTKNNELYAQSRSNVLSLEKDNAGFCQFFETNLDFFKNWLNGISKQGFQYVSIYGEWCGGSIQKGVALNDLEKMFVVFAIRYSNFDEENSIHSVWDFDEIVVPFNNLRIYSINEFSSYNIIIDFNVPENSQNQLIEYTNDVEEECPIGKYFGVSGIGEGIVWHSKFNNRHLLFKVKGERHSSSKVRKLAAVDVEIIKNTKELVESIVSENRLNQGVQVLTEQGIEITNKATKDFIDWVRKDVLKEEKDTILASGLDFSKILAAVSSKAGQWFNQR